MRMKAGLASAFGALAIAAAVPAASGATTSCHPTGTVLAQRGGVVIWTAPVAGRHPVFICASPHGGNRSLYRDSINPRVSQLRFAGHYVGFFLRTNIEVDSKFLIAFDRTRARTELKELAECDGNDECPTFPPITGYALSKTGWVAEIYLNSPAGFFSDATGFGPDILIATNNGRHHYQLDIARTIAHLSLSGGTLSWADDIGGGSSVKLSSVVVTPSSPQPLAACQLLTPGEIDLVLGPGALVQPNSPTGCVATSQTNSAMGLTFAAQTGLSPAQVKADEAALQTNTNPWDNVSYPNDDNFQIYETSDGAGHEYADAFANGALVMFALSGAGPNAEEQLGYLANVALDRLFGVPVTRAN